MPNHASENYEFSNVKLSEKEQQLTQLECELEECAIRLSSMEHYDEYNSGILVVKMVKCGKKGCRCEHGALHGPYAYYQYRDKKGKLKQKYLNPKIRDKAVDMIRANVAYRKELARMHSLERKIEQFTKEAGIYGG